MAGRSYALRYKYEKDKKHHKKILKGKSRLFQSRHSCSSHNCMRRRSLCIDNSGSVQTNDKGEIVLKRGKENEERVHEMKVKIGESGADRKIEIQ